MVLYVGEAVTIVAAALNPLRNNVAITDAVAKVDFFAPGKDPKGNPADRTPDQGDLPMIYDALATFQTAQTSVVGAYVCYAETAGWEPGKWSYRVTLTGNEYESVEYSTFTLKA